MSIATLAFFFFWISICMEYIFPSPHYQCACVPRSEVVSCRQHVYRSCFSIHLAIMCLLVGSFNPFTFKVIIDVYVLIAILFTVLNLFLCAFFPSLPLLFSSLVIWWLSLCCVWIALSFFVCFFCRFLVCSYHVLIDSLNIYKIILSCWSLNFKCISNILHLYSPHNCWFWYICVWMISYLYCIFAFTS